MQEFIESAVSQLGINEDQAKSATGGLLNYLKDQDGHDVQALIAKLPGAEDLMKSMGSGSESGGSGMLGGLGSKLGGSGGAMAALQGSGLDASRAGPFVKMLVDYAKQKVGPEQVEQVLAKVPALKNLM
ncbi:MAG: DUF2780 domain-containing protein [Candidatus Binatia bacterium]